LEENMENIIVHQAKPLTIDSIAQTFYEEYNVPIEETKRILAVHKVDTVIDLKKELSKVANQTYKEQADLQRELIEVNKQLKEESKAHEPYSPEVVGYSMKREYLRGCFNVISRLNVYLTSFSQFKVTQLKQMNNGKHGLRKW
jgi:hypothetical protein